MIDLPDININRALLTIPLVIAPMEVVTIDMIAITHVTILLDADDVLDLILSPV